MPTALPEISHVLVQHPYCLCAPCRAAVVRKVFAKTAEIRARVAAQAAQEEAEEWSSRLARAKTLAARYEAYDRLSRQGADDTRIQRIPGGMGRVTGGSR